MLYSVFLNHLIVIVYTNRRLKLKNLNNGIFYMLVSSFLGAFNGSFAKVLSVYIPALEIVFFRNALGVIIILAMLKHTPASIDIKNLHLLIIRGILGFIAMFLFFYTIAVIPLSDAVTLNKTSSIFVGLLSFLILKENLNIYKIVALILGFLGVILIMKPVGIDYSFSYIIGVLGGFFSAAAYTTIGKIKHLFDSRLIVLSFMGIGTIFPLIMFLLAPYLPQNPLITEFVFPNSLKVYSIIILMALIATLSQWFLTKAYSSPNITVVATISYTIIPFSVFFGVFLGDKLPDIINVAGVAFIVVAGILAKKGEK